MVRKRLAAWADDEGIEFEGLEEWKKTAKICKFKNEMANVCLWMDSTDVKIEGIRKKSRKGPERSYKLNAPGRRYMVVQNAKRRVIKLYGGSVPKLMMVHF